MTQKKHYRISLDNSQPTKRNYRHDGCEGFSWNNDHAFSDNIEDWMMGKYRRHTRKANPNLF